jgi:hypothetical protein
MTITVTKLKTDELAVTRMQYACYDFWLFKHIAYVYNKIRGIQYKEQLLSVMWSP